MRKIELVQECLPMVATFQRWLFNREPPVCVLHRSFDIELRASTCARAYLCNLPVASPSVAWPGSHSRAGKQSIFKRSQLKPARGWLQSSSPLVIHSIASRIIPSTCHYSSSSREKINQISRFTNISTACQLRRHLVNKLCRLQSSRRKQ